MATELVSGIFVHERLESKSSVSLAQEPVVLESVVQDLQDKLFAHVERQDVRADGSPAARSDPLRAEELGTLQKEVARQAAELQENQDAVLEGTRRLQQQLTKLEIDGEDAAHAGRAAQQDHKLETVALQADMAALQQRVAEVRPALRCQLSSR